MRMPRPNNARAVRAFRAQTRRANVARAKAQQAQTLKAVSGSPPAVPLPGSLP